MAFMIILLDFLFVLFQRAPLVQLVWRAKPAPKGGITHP
jgi:hypothetical protein